MRRLRNNDLYDFPSEKKKGIIGTLIFHVVLAVILIITGFHAPETLPEEEGILVNFGTDETGSGLLEPAASSAMEESSQADLEQPSTDELIEEISNESVSQTQATETQMTQDFEEAPVVEKKVEQPDPEKERRRQEALEAERVRQQELEKERLKREAEEAAEAEKRRIEEEQRQQTEKIRNLTRGALERANARGTDTTGEGITEGRGNQGKETGVVGAANYGEGGGTGSEGVSFDLAGRQATSLPKPTYDIQEEGKVVVDIWVDRNGNVTRAVPGVKGSETLNEDLLRLAKEAAEKAKFDPKQDARDFQKGTITYYFIFR